MLIEYPAADRRSPHGSPTRTPGPKPRRPRFRAGFDPLEARTLLTDSSVGGLGETLRAAWGDGTPGKPVPFTVTALPGSAAARVQLSVTGDGVFAGLRQSLSLNGPWSATPSSLSFTATPSGLGAGHVAVEAQAVDASGRVVGTDRADAYALYEPGKVWSSAASMTDLMGNRLDALLASGAIDPATYQAGRDAMVTADATSTVSAIAAAPPVAAALSVHTLAAPSTVNVSGTIRWTDAGGGIHRVPRAPVEIYGSDGGAPVLIAKAVTSRLGEYSVDVTPAAGASSLFVQVYARSPYADVKPEATGSVTYRMHSPLVPLSGPSSFVVDVTADNVTDAGRAFAVDAAMEMVGTYAASLAGKSLPLLPTFFPEVPKLSQGEPAGGISQYSSANGAMYVRATAWNQFDVTDHEYGHYFAASFAFDKSLGGMHSSLTNLVPINGNPAGVWLAWSEGWATYFSLAGQISAGYGDLGIPTVGDHTYTGLSSYSMDTLNADGRALGEDNEGTVQGVLWNMWLTGQSATSGSSLSYTDKAIFDIINGASTATLGDFWGAAASTLSSEKRSQLGKIFGDMNVAPVPISPADNFDARTAATPPTFKWRNNGAGTSFPNDNFVVKFFSADFKTELFTSPSSEVVVGPSTSTWTPSAEQWKTIAAGGPGLHWLVAGKNTTLGTPAGAVDRYWGPARTINGGVSLAFVIDTTGSMSTEIDGVKAALQGFIDSLSSLLPPGAPVPVMELITFVDSPNVVTVSNDLGKLRASIASLGAGGGGDCPEPSAVSLQRAIEDVGPGGTILLVTDASSDPGVSISGLIARARAKGITVNAEISGDCSGVGSEGGPDSTSSGPIGAALSVVSAALRAAGSGDTEPDGDADCDCGTGHCNGDAEATETTTVGLPAAAAAATVTATASATGGGHAEPGAGTTSEPPRGPITVEFGPPDDPNGHSVAEATVLPLGPSPVRGYVPTPGGESDVFAVAVRGGTRYAVEVHREGGGVPTVDVIDADGTTKLFTVYTLTTLESGEALNRYTFPFTPGRTGTFFIRVSSSDPNVPVPFRIAVKEDPLAGVTSSIEAFSSVAFQTGGTFNVRTSVKSGDRQPYVADVFNVLASTVAPAVLAANPGVLPQGETLRVSLTGRGTNWRQGVTTVQFAGAGVRVLDVNVVSPTSLTALVQVDPGAAATFRDVAVRSSLGTATVTASGRNVVAVGDPISRPTLLSVETSTLQRGQTATLQIRGAKTNWDSASVLTLGPGVKIGSYKVVSPTLIEATVTIDPGAKVGFRTATVTNSASVDSGSRALFVGIGALSSVPQLVSLTPPVARLGQTATVTVVGSGTHFQPGLTTASFGDGVTVKSLVVNDPTHATVTVQVAAGAALGFRDVRLTTGAESAAILNGFFLDAATTPPPVGPTDPAAPALAALVREGYHAQPTVLTVTYTAAMSAAAAGDARNYLVYDLGAGYHPNARPLRIVKVSLAGYDPATHSVRLVTAARLPLRHLFKLVVRTGTGGVTGATGKTLVGATNGWGGKTVSVLFGPEALKNGPRLTLGPRDPWAAKAKLVRPAHATPARAASPKR